MSDMAKSIGSSFLQNRSDLFIAVFIIVIVIMLIIPLPTFMLDFFMISNIALGLIIILTVLSTRKALDFSIFPTLLLITTIFGLALNVSSTRLILSMGSEFDGRIVKVFAEFVVGGTSSGEFTGDKLVIGVIIFLILIAVQFIVITKGATRVAEVAARFTLDALPGKQMAIEAEYNSGALTEEEATQKKNELQREVDFYGAMDGSTKFVSGNVVVGILITAVNIIGGMIVGITLHHESPGNVASTYLSLAVGDGLVSQIPTLLISVSTGLIVTRAGTDGTLGQDAARQFMRQGRVYWIASFLLFVMVFIPGSPKFILIIMASLTGFLGFYISRKEIRDAEKVKFSAEAERRAEAPPEISPVVPLDPLSLELGYGLIPLVDKEQGAELLDRITRIRRESALDLGLVVPRIRIIDNMRLEPSEYSFKIKGVEVGRGTIRMGYYMAINPGNVREEVAGEETRDPAFGLPALWITEETREKAERNGYTVVDSPSIIATHLTEIIKRYASEILGRQEVQSILDTLKNDYPAVVNEVAKILSNGEIQKVLQGLLKEDVSIRNMIAILENLADYGNISKDIGFLVEKSRQALGRQICLQYADENKVIKILTIDSELEKTIIDSRVETAAGNVASLNPETQRAWINSLLNSIKIAQDMGHYPIILCSEASRQLVKQSTIRDIPELVVLSLPEIAFDIQIEKIGEIKLEG